MKKTPVNLSRDKKKEFIKKHKALFDKYMVDNSSLARMELKMLVVEELGYSRFTYWPDMGFDHLYMKMYPKDN